MIRFSCPGCQKVYSVPDDKGGKTGKCPDCGSQFVIPMAEGGSSPPAPSPQSAPAPEPKPEPAGPEKDFSFDGSGDEEAPKKKKSRRRDDDDMDEEDEKPKKRRSKYRDDDDDEDDYYDREEYGSRRDRQPPGGGFAIAGGVVHFIFAALLLGCGVCGVIGGASLAALGGAGNQAATSNIKSGPGSNPQAQQLADDSAKISRLGTVLLSVGVCNIIFGLLAIPAGIGCVMRKPFGKYLSFVVGPAVLFIRLVSEIVSIAIIGTENLGARGGGSVGGYAGACIGMVLLAFYAGFTIFAAIKGIPNAAPASSSRRR